MANRETLGSRSVHARVAFRPLCAEADPRRDTGAAARDAATRHHLRPRATASRAWAACRPHTTGLNDAESAECRGTLQPDTDPAVRAPQVCLKKSAHCSWRAKLGEEASCLRRPVCGCYWLIVCLHSWLLSALILFRAEYRPYGGRSFRDLRSPFGYSPSESRSPPHTGHRISTRGT